MIDVVYPLGTGSQYNNLELRYSLRSIERYLTGVRDIYVISGYFKGFSGLKWLPFTETSKDSDANICAKLRYACKHETITDPFLMFNDDHYLLSPFYAPDFPFLNSGSIKNYLKKRAKDSYWRKAKNTFDLMNDPEALFYDIHTPILIYKEDFLKTTETLDWGKKSYIIKSIYGKGHPGPFMRDGKLNNPPLDDLTIFSTHPTIIKPILAYLANKFPEPSKYEERERN